MIKVENKHLGTMYLDVSEEERIKLLDSNKRYVGYTCYFEKKDIQETINKLIEIKHISDIFDLGFCYNMFFGKSIEELKWTYKEYLENNNYCKDGFEETIEEYHNQIGNNYFLIDYDDL